MSTAVILLNWNGTADTLECVASLRRAEPGMHLVVVDNASEPAEREALGVGLVALGLEVRSVTAGQAVQQYEEVTTDCVLLIQSDENLGFAGGCNLGLRVVSAAGHRWTVFLNNDTVVEPGALGLLVGRLAVDTSVAVTLPLIGIYDTDRAWNAGGRLWPALGLRRYHYAGAPLAVARRQPELDCTFFTGCCFAIDTARMVARGGFCERFFFGEEDMELSFWMHGQGLRICCLTRALVWHKVSASVNRASGSHVQRRIQAHYLNRFVHLRTRWGRWRWVLWLMGYLPYTAALLWLTRLMPASRLPAFLANLVRMATRLDGVNRATFQTIMAGGFDALSPPPPRHTPQSR